MRARVDDGEAAGRVTREDLPSIDARAWLGALGGGAAEGRARGGGRQGACLEQVTRHLTELGELDDAARRAAAAERQEEAADARGALLGLHRLE